MAPPGGQDGVLRPSEKGGPTASRSAADYFKEEEDDDGDEGAGRKKRCPHRIPTMPKLARELASRSPWVYCEGGSQEHPCIYSKELQSLWDDFSASEGRPAARASWAALVQAWHGGWQDYVMSVEDSIRFVMAQRTQKLTPDFLREDVNAAEAYDEMATALHVTKFVLTHPVIGARFGSREMMSGLNLYHLLLANMTSACPPGREGCDPAEVPLHPGDLEAWQALFDSTGGATRWTGCRRTRDRPCDCFAVTCETDWPTGSRRIVGIDFTTHNIVGVLPRAMTSLSALRALVIVSNPSFDSQSAETQSTIVRLPALQSLAIDWPIPGILTEDLNDPDVTIHRTLIGISIQFAGQHRIPPDAIAWVCRLRSLRSFTQVGGLLGLPACMGTGNPDLVDIDVRGGRFGEHPTGTPFPPELGKLQRVRSLIAFQQGPMYCPPHPAGTPIAKVVETCKPNFDSIVLADSPMWFCAPTAWTVRMDDPTQPWWQWRTLERFWLDGNFIGGRLPEWIGSAWPSMRSIDLYSNDVEGPLPQGLQRLRHLEQLQIQHNKLSGILPPTFFTPRNFPRLYHLNLQLNPDLKGCISMAPLLYRGDPMRPKGVLSLNLGVRGSSIIVRKECSLEADYSTLPRTTDLLLPDADSAPPEEQV